MEDYNKVSFRDMVSAKIQKKDSERGNIQGTGFPIHGGKPIKELYRTVYTGGPGCPGEQYMKEPVMEIHHTTTNDDGVSQKTLKSSEAEAEHSEKSIRDMVADRNATGFVKAGVPYKTRQDKVDTKRAEAESLRTNDIDSGLDVALANHEADELEADGEPGDVLEEGAGNIGSQTWYNDVKNPSPVVDQQQIAIANDIQDDPSQSMRSFLGGDPITKEKVVNSSLDERDDRIFNPQNHEPPVWKQNSGAYADAMIGTNRV